MNRSSGEHFAIERIGATTILYAPQQLANPRPGLFDPGQLAENGQLVGQASGRGTTWFFNEQGREWVLRHFCRGGWIGRFVADRYVGVRAENSRAFREWRLLAELVRQGLPVPRPVAAAFHGDGFLYRCDLITERLPRAEPLADLLAREPLPASSWQQVGATIKRFHSRGVYHADMNARNILIDASGSVALIDFDRGRFRKGSHWQQATLRRLLRSLRKIRSSAARFYFSADDWQDLLRGYHLKP